MPTPSPSSRNCAVRSVRPTTAGTRLTVGPALSHTFTLRGRRAVLPDTGSCARISPAGTFGSDRRDSSTLSGRPSSVSDVLA